jgi:hypothetical protein
MISPLMLSWNHTFFYPASTLFVLTQATTPLRHCLDVALGSTTPCSADTWTRLREHICIAWECDPRCLPLAGTWSMPPKHPASRVWISCDLIKWYLVVSVLNLGANFSLGEEDIIKRWGCTRHSPRRLEFRTFIHNVVGVTLVVILCITLQTFSWWLL